MISVFDMFKVGIGPSSSHTVGPMKAGKEFVDQLVEKNLLSSVTRIAVDIYGSLSLTGKGHHTDIAIIMGLAGNLPATVDIESIADFIANVEQTERLSLANTSHYVDFPRQGGINFHYNNLPLHENGMTITAFNNDKQIFSKTYYSIGGGFIVDEEHFGQQISTNKKVPYAYNSAAELLLHCKKTGLSVSSLMMKNQLALHTKEEIDHYFANIWHTMQACIDRGLNTEGILPDPRRHYIAF